MHYRTPPINAPISAAEPPLQPQDSAAEWAEGPGAVGSDTIGAMQGRTKKQLEERGLVLEHKRELFREYGGMQEQRRIGDCGAAQQQQQQAQQQQLLLRGAVQSNSRCPSSGSLVSFEPPSAISGAQVCGIGEGSFSRPPPPASITIDEPLVAWPTSAAAAIGALAVGVQAKSRYGHTKI